MKPGDRVRLDPQTNRRTGRIERHFTRLGTVVARKHRKTTRAVHVLWDDCKFPVPIATRFLELVEAANDTT
jgi:hypothetical protein